MKAFHIALLGNVNTDNIDWQAFGKGIAVDGVPTFEEYLGQIVRDCLSDRDFRFVAELAAVEVQIHG